MRQTGVFATDDERQRLQEMARRASRTPMITFRAGVAPPSPWEPVHKAVHKAALEHGLPEIRGYYGMAEDGEFVEALGP